MRLQETQHGDTPILPSPLPPPGGRRGTKRPLASEGLIQRVQQEEKRKQWLLRRGGAGQQLVVSDAAGDHEPVPLWEAEDPSLDPQQQQPPPAMPAKIARQLKPHQLEGVRFLYQVGGAAAGVARAVCVGWRRGRYGQVWQ